MAKPIRRALLSVSDKRGISQLGQALADLGVEILSTGGTASLLADAGVPVKEVASHTGFPEMMDGRGKTLHPKAHGGLLHLRGNAEHEAFGSKSRFANNNNGKSIFRPQTSRFY